LKSLLLLTAALALFAFPASAIAGTLTFTTATTAANTNTNTDNLNETDYAGGANQFDLDHHRAYTWGITGINLSGQGITSATITFKNIANWDTNANKLFVHLFNSAGTFASTNGTRTATSNGITSYVDDAGDPQLTILDNFAAANLGANTLNVSTGTGNTYLFEASFNMVGQGGYVAQDYVYTFTPAQLATLASYIASGNDIAFGFDPDCHFWNNGIVFTLGTTNVPEPISMVLLGSGLAGLYFRRRRQQN
jgi:hypothetical protein